MENNKTDVNPIPINFKKLKQLVKSLEDSLADDTPIVLMDLNEVFYRVLEVMTFGSENIKQKPTFAAISFEPLVLKDDKVVTGELNKFEQVLQNITGLDDQGIKKVSQILNSHGYFAIAIDELGKIRQEARQFNILQAQNKELREHIDNLLIDIADKQEHIDNLLGMLSEHKKH